MCEAYNTGNNTFYLNAITGSSNIHKTKRYYCIYDTLMYKIYTDFFNTKLRIQKKSVMSCNFARASQQTSFNITNTCTKPKLKTYTQSRINIIFNFNSKITLYIVLSAEDDS